MKLSVIGSGTCFAPISVGNSNFLLEHNGKMLMIDWGTTATYILRDELGIDLHKPDVVALHVHPDHTALSPFALFRYFVPNAEGEIVKPKLYLAQPLVHPLWENTLKGDLESIYGKVTKFNDWFDLQIIQKNKSFIWEGAKFTLFQVTHVPNCFVIKPAYGIMIETENNCLMITGDTIYSPDSLSYLYERASIIFQDTEVGPRSKVHANFEDLKNLPDHIKAKMYCYHYNKIPDDLCGFAGFLKKGQTFEI